jgi:large subunit ribosomal protein L24
MATRAKVNKILHRQIGHPKKILNKPSVKEAAKKTKWNIVRGDQVQVISKYHPENGKQGIVLQVDRKNDQLLIENVNKRNRYVKGNAELGTAGKMIQKEVPIHYSNVNLVDPVTGYPTRVIRKYLEDGTKVRVAKKSGAIIPKPEILTQRKKPVSMTVTDSDTADDDDVWEMTWDPNSLLLPLNKDDE